jgi:hypothetical protein
MQIWEEGYVSNPISFEMMHTQMVAVLEGAPLRRADGRLDRERIMRYVESACGSSEFFRLRLQRSLLGLTPPAWVPDEHFDIARHVVFADGIGTLTSSQLWTLSGHSDGVMSTDHPLWRLRFTELDNGDVALGSIFHHASLDGLSATKILGSFMQRSADQEPRAAVNPFAAVRAPHRVELPLLAAREWLRAQPNAAAGWRAYWSKPFHRRVRRVGARVLRPLRNRGLQSDDVRAQRLPPRHSDFRTLNSQVVARNAANLDCTISDLLVASIIKAYDGENPNVSLRYPVSQRTPTKVKARNQVQDMELYGNASDSLEDTLKSVRRQVDNRSEHPFNDNPVRDRQIGYVTVIPWVSRPCYFSGARVTEVAPFAASLGTDELSAAGVLYDGMLSVTVTMQAASDVTSVVEHVERLMTGVSETANA